MRYCVLKQLVQRAKMYKLKIKCLILAKVNQANKKIGLVWRNVTFYKDYQ